MLQIAVIVLAVFTAIMGIKGFTPSGIDLGIKGRRFTGQSGIIAGILLIVLAAMMVVFAMFILPLIIRGMSHR